MLMNPVIMTKKFDNLIKFLKEFNLDLIMSI